MVYNIVYKGECPYIDNNWHVGDCLEATFYYDKKDKSYYVKTKLGAKMKDKNGYAIHLCYNQWQDVLDDWIVPQYCRVYQWIEQTEVAQTVLGNSDFDNILSSKIAIIDGRIAMQIHGIKKGVTADVTMIARFK